MHKQNPYEEAEVFTKNIITKQTLQTSKNSTSSVIN
jgi:hypothetical protein